MKPNVLFTASTFSHIVNFHRPYLREFARLGFSVTVACGGVPMDIPEAARVVTIPFEKSISSPKNLAALRALRREIHTGDYALVSCHTSLAAFFTRMAVMGMRARPTMVCTAHGYLFDDDTSATRRLLLAGAEKIVAPVTDLLMTMNAWDFSYAVSHHLGKRVVNIPGMGVDFSRLRCAGTAEGAALRGEWGFSHEDFLLVYAAEFSNRKNQSTLLHALTRLPPSVGLLLPGSGTLREDCMELAEQLGVSGRVVFPGQVWDMAPWYDAADAAVSASRSEGLPFNVMEAMGRGLPVVASAVKGHTELITHGKTGLLFAVGDADACATQISALLGNPDLALQLGQAGATVTQRYDINCVLPQVMAEYTVLLPHTNLAPIRRS